MAKTENHSVHPTKDPEALVQDLNIQLQAITERLRSIESDINGLQITVYSLGVRIGNLEA